MSKRKYRKGDKITSLDELAKQEFVFFFNKITHCGWFMSWQFRLAQNYIERGVLYYAVRDCDGNCQECKSAKWESRGWWDEPRIVGCELHSTESEGADDGKR